MTVVVKRPRKPSAIQLRALAIIRDRGQTMFPSKFSSLLWDTSDWEPHTVGKTGGAYLDRLTRMGLIETTKWGYALTENGEKRLKES